MADFTSPKAPSEADRNSMGVWGNDKVEGEQVSELKEATDSNTTLSAAGSRAQAGRDKTCSSSQPPSLSSPTLLPETDIALSAPPRSIRPGSDVFSAAEPLLIKEDQAQKETMTEVQVDQEEAQMHEEKPAEGQTKEGDDEDFNMDLAEVMLPAAAVVEVTPEELPLWAAQQEVVEEAQRQVRRWIGSTLNAIHGGTQKLERRHIRYNDLRCVAEHVDDLLGSIANRTKPLTTLDEIWGEIRRELQKRYPGLLAAGFAADLGEGEEGQGRECHAAYQAEGGIDDGLNPGDHDVGEEDLPAQAEGVGMEDGRGANYHGDDAAADGERQEPLVVVYDESLNLGLYAPIHRDSTIAQRFALPLVAEFIRMEVGYWAPPGHGLHDDINLWAVDVIREADGRFSYYIDVHLSNVDSSRAPRPYLDQVLPGQIRWAAGFGTSHIHRVEALIGAAMDRVMQKHGWRDGTPVARL